VATIGSLFYSNSCGRAGGGLEYFSGSNFDVTNCTFSKNSASYSGAGISAYGSTTTIANCIVYENIPNTKNFVKLGGGVIHASFTLAQEASSYFNSATSLINSNPLYTDFANNDFTLMSGSPCIDSGNPSASGLNLPDTDLVGNTRIAEGRVDMGAYESAVVIFYPVLYAIGDGYWSDTSLWSDTENGSSVNISPGLVNAGKVIIKNHTIEVNATHNCTNLEIDHVNNSTALVISSGTLYVAGEARIKGGTVKLENSGALEIITTP
jgi:parallel beta-helix repeat protein